MKRKFNVINISEFKHIRIDFEDKKYGMLSTLFFTDGSTICSFALEKYEEIRDGRISKWSATGNACSIEMTSDNTNVYDIFNDTNYCSLCTDDFIELIYEWKKEVEKINEML